MIDDPTRTLRIVAVFTCTLLACVPSNQDLQNIRSTQSAVPPPVTPTISVGYRPPGRPQCDGGPGRRAEELGAGVLEGTPLTLQGTGGWILELVPIQHGWFLEITMKGREEEDLSRLTPPWHGVPNPREIEGWHFRNEANTGPNDGSVNAPGKLREFIFSPEVGRGIENGRGATTAASVARVEAFGRGWLHLDQFRLTPPRRSERASFEWLEFTACLTWPAA